MIEALKPWNSFGKAEWKAVEDFAGNALLSSGGFPLSGYLAGKERGGVYVQMLEEAWAKEFGVEHAIAVNSATSGLMAAAFAVGLKDGDRFACPAMTMSATAAAPSFTGAKPYFCDVESETFGIMDVPPYDVPVFVANLFGHPARLGDLRLWCDAHHTVLIEDNSQSPFAWERSRFTGTIGHIGVFSLNVHKPLQCGEGGMVVTDDDLFAAKMRAFINHGEHTTNTPGLNLRMPEICAAIASAQLKRGEEIVQGRIDQAQAILASIGHINGLRMPITRPGCRHVFYTIPFILEERRAEFCGALRHLGVPIVEGYVEPLYKLAPWKSRARPTPVAESLHSHRLFYFENCAWDLTLQQCEQVGAAFQKAAKVL